MVRSCSSSEGRLTLRRGFEQRGSKKPLSPVVMGKIVAASGRNLRKAMLMLESCHVKAGADPITDQVSTSLSCSPDPDSSQHRTAALSLSSCGDISLEEGGEQKK